MHAMDKPVKFVLPPPNFGGNAGEANKTKMHYLTPSGMTLLRRDKQPPPMYGPRGATVPPKYLRQQQHGQQHSQKPQESHAAPVERQYCEACDMELQTERDMQRHRAQHEACPVDGCKFRGHPNVMDRHVMTLHNTAFAEQLPKLNTPEEIAAWREERRKKYPTLANIKMREMARQQREKRGERLVTNQNRFGRAEDRRRIHNTDTNKERVNESKPSAKTAPQQRKLPKHAARKREFPAKLALETSKQMQAATAARDEEIEMNKFKGTKHMPNYKRVPLPWKAQPNALAGLLTMYGSDSDMSDSDEALTSGNEDDAQQRPDNSSITNCDRGEVEQAIAEPAAAEIETTLEPTGAMPLAAAIIRKEAEKLLQQQQTTEQARVETPTQSVPHDVEEEAAARSSDDDAPEEAPIAHTSKDLTAQLTSSPLPAAEPQSTATKPTAKAHMREKLQRKRKSGLDYSKARLRKQNTMLAKLLEPEIRHERNVLLQCVRFVCENNFFGIGQPPEKQN